MELQELKSVWNRIETPAKTIEDLQLMLLENKHPVLKGIRKQITIEIFGWLVFILCYYTLFDGDRKPIWINTILIVSVLLPLLNNFMGYRFAKYLVKGATVSKSLAIYLAKLKTYAYVSVILRLVFVTGLVLFFTFGLNFNTGKYVSFALIILIFTVQLFLLYKLWVKRLNRLETAVQSLTTNG